MDLWEHDPSTLRRAYEGQLLKAWTEADERVAAREASAEITSRRKRSKDDALLAKYNAGEGRGL